MLAAFNNCFRLNSKFLEDGQATVNRHDRFNRCFGFSEQSVPLSPVLAGQVGRVAKGHLRFGVAQVRGRSVVEAPELHMQTVSHHEFVVHRRVVLAPENRDALRRQVIDGLIAALIVGVLCVIDHHVNINAACLGLSQREGNVIAGERVRETWFKSQNCSLTTIFP